MDQSGTSITDSRPSGLGPSDMCICVEGERKEQATVLSVFFSNTAAFVIIVVTQNGFICDKVGVTISHLVMVK